MLHRCNLNSAKVSPSLLIERSLPIALIVGCRREEIAHNSERKFVRVVVVVFGLQLFSASAAPCGSASHGSIAPTCSTWPRR